MIVATLAVAASVVAILLVRNDEESAPDPVRRADPVLDLLGWIPATDDAQRAFSVWSEDPGGNGTPVTISAADPFLDRLALTPVPFTLGRSGAWPDRFGYRAREVTGWATAGTGAPVAVLGGAFDRDAISQKLTDAGYRKSSYRGVALYVLHDVATPSRTIDGDAVSAASAVAFYDGRLITATSADAARAAIDAAQGRIPSLADEPAVAEVVGALAPVSGLVAVDAADQAVDCGLGRGWTRRGLDRSSGRYVVVGYGRLGSGGERRTLVATSYADTAAAGKALDTYKAGWESGLVITTQAGVEVAALGSVSAVGQTDEWLIAELVDGREDGWVRAGIRFARPVCAAAETALPPGTPVSATTAPVVEGPRESPEGGTT